MHHVANLCLGFGLGYGLAARTGDVRWTAAGFAIALGWTLLSLHNDCRYKAFFQCLKRERTTYRVTGGSGGQPVPAPGWPTRGLGIVTWPAYKLCESHVVLVWLTILAGCALISLRIWTLGWQSSVLIGSIAVPLLALARIARTIARGRVEQEFSCWFQPAEADDRDTSPERAGNEPFLGSGS
jgi:hypothetical protein